MSPRASRSRITPRRAAGFVFWFLLIFFVTFTGLYFAGLVPSELQTNSDGIAGELFPSAEPEAVGEEPVQIVIKSIGVNAVVANPTTTDTKVLDDALLHGAVRYPGSGLAGKGNMFLFGHSTGYKVVHNQAYKTFNDIKTLKKGDSISVFSKENEYLYEVDKVTLVDADKALVEFGTGDKKLTLSTCNTFGEKQERYVVEASYIGSRAKVL